MVPGANSGVGFEVAQYLARRGAEVHLVCRSAQRGEEARLRLAEEEGDPEAPEVATALNNLAELLKVLA